MLHTRGMDLLRPGDPEPSEVAAFRSSYDRTHGGLPAAYEFWLEFDPGVVKAHRLQAYHSSTEEHRAIPLHGTLGFLHLYVVMGYEAGIRYEVAHSRSLGASKAAVLQAVELAFIHCGPRGVDAAWHGAADLLRDWEEPASTPSFPEHWAPDPDAFRLDLDLTTAEASPAERAEIEDWYLRRLGELPGYVGFLLGTRPGLLKAFHHRLARAMTGPLPAQLCPFLLLQMYVARADGDGMRAAYQLGLGLGMTADELGEAVAWGSMYGGPSACSRLASVAADLVGPDHGGQDIL